MIFAVLFLLKASSIFGDMKRLVGKSPVYRAILNDLLDGKISLAFIVNEKMVFADKERMGGEKVTHSSFCNGDILAFIFIIQYVFVRSSICFTSK